MKLEQHAEAYAYAHVQVAAGLEGHALVQLGSGVRPVEMWRNRFDSLEICTAGA